jgi:hypothetical protein
MSSGKSGSLMKFLKVWMGVEDRLVEASVALENDQKLVASTTGFDWIINCPLTAI